MAAPVFNKSFIQDMNAPVLIRHGGGLMFTGDNLSDTISVTLYRDSLAATIESGTTCVCYVIRPDGDTVTFPGTVTGNVASATLPQSCFAVTGQIGVALQLVKSTVKTTVFKALYTVERVTTDTTIDPGSVVPDIADLLDELDDMREATDAANAAAGKAVLFNSRTYIDTASRETAIEFPFTGWIKTTDGELSPIQTSYASTDFISLADVTGIYRTGTTTQFALWRYAFYDANKDFLGAEDDTTEYDIVTHDGKSVTWLDLTGYPSAVYIRITTQPARPYTYYLCENYNVYTYDIPTSTMDNVPVLRFAGKKIVNFGDSIFGNFRDTNDTTDKSISKMIADATGATVYNAGFGGCRMATHSQLWDAFSMHSVADSIAAGDWSVQQYAIDHDDNNALPSYFQETVTMLAGLNFSEIDYITIGYGVNDYTGNVWLHPIQGVSYEHEWETFEGALRYSLRTILTAYPNLRIIVISPCWMWFRSDGAYSYSSDDYAQAHNNRKNYYDESTETWMYCYLPDYVNACKDICNEYHVAYIDTYYTLGFNRYSIPEYFYSTDGTHPNYKGRQLRADRIVGQMSALY